MNQQHRTILQERRNPLAGPIEDAIIEKSIALRINDSVQVSKKVGVQAYKIIVRPTLVLTGAVAVGTIVVTAVIISSIVKEVVSTIRPKRFKKLSNLKDSTSNTTINFNGTTNFYGPVHIENHK